MCAAAFCLGTKSRAKDRFVYEDGRSAPKAKGSSYRRLYAEAIAQFWALSRALETQLEVHKGHPMVARVRELGLSVTPGYASDLRQLLGEDWDAAANEVLLTAATRDYVAALLEADPVSLTAAAFILYGALVVGGGKSTQAKVAKIFPRCDHATFDLSLIHI